MQRFLIPTVTGDPEVVTLTGDEAHHASRVVRIRPGEAVVLLDGAGLELSGTVEAVGKREVHVRVSGRQDHAPRGTSVTLVQAIAKGPAMEGLIHRAVELGCRRLVPLLSERSVSRPEDAIGKCAKWQSIADEALKQSGNPWRMIVDAPITPGAWIARAEPFDLLLIGSLLGNPVHPRTHFDRHIAAHGRTPGSVGVVVGPEGDFSPAEYCAFQQAGALPITLGPLILRVETAATALLAIVGHEVTAPPGHGVQPH